MDWFNNATNPSSNGMASISGLNAELGRQAKAMIDAQNELRNRLDTESMAREEAWKKERDAERKQNAEKVQALEKQLNEEKQAGAQKVQALEKQLEDERNAAAEKMKALEKELSEARQVAEKKNQELARKLAVYEAENQREIAKVREWESKKGAMSRRSAGTFSAYSSLMDKTAVANYFDAQFSEPNLTTPRVITGLNLIDLSNSAHVRLKADVVCVTNEGFAGRLHSWDDTVQYAAGCAWMQIPSEDTGIQVGEFSTEEDHPVQNPQDRTTKRIQFPQRYDYIPIVVVWLNGLDVDRGGNCRVKVYATDITPDGFTIHIDAWGDTRLYMGRAGWIAFSSRRDICAGTFSTDDVRPCSQPRHDNRSSVCLHACFNAPPKMFVALNALDIDRTRNFRVRIGEGTVSEFRYDWSLESWADTILYMAGATYIAFDNSAL